MNDSISALLRLLPFPAVYAADPPIPSPMLTKLLSAADCALFFSDPAQVPDHLAIGDSVYSLTPSPEDPALIFLTLRNQIDHVDENGALQKFLTDVATPLSNLVLMGSMLGRSEVSPKAIPYIDQMRRTTDQITRLHYNATPQPASFELEHLPELIRDTLGYVGYYMPELSLSFREEGMGDPYVTLSRPHVEGLILNLLSEILSLADRSAPLPAFTFTLRHRESPCLLVHVDSSSIPFRDVEHLLFDPTPTSFGFLFIRRACSLHMGTLLLRKDGNGGFTFTFTFPRREDHPTPIGNFLAPYSGYEQARMLLSNHLDLSCYQNVKR